MTKQRFICANCGYVFDKYMSVEDELTSDANICCPDCGSNACDIYFAIKKKWKKEDKSNI